METHKIYLRLIWVVCVHTIFNGNNHNNNNNNAHTKTVLIWLWVEIWYFKPEYVALYVYIASMFISRTEIWWRWQCELSMLPVYCLPPVNTCIDPRWQFWRRAEINKYAKLYARFFTQAPPSDLWQLSYSRATCVRHKAAFVGVWFCFYFCFWFRFVFVFGACTVYFYCRLARFCYIYVAVWQKANAPICHLENVLTVGNKRRPLATVSRRLASVNALQEIVDYWTLWM